LETIGDRNYLAGVNVLRMLLNTIRMV
jgi:hypothetical protein